MAANSSISRASQNLNSSRLPSGAIVEAEAVGRLDIFSGPVIAKTALGGRSDEMANRVGGLRLFCVGVLVSLSPERIRIYHRATVHYIWWILKSPDFVQDLSL